MDGDVVEVRAERGSQSARVGQGHAAAAQLARRLAVQLLDEGGDGHHRAEGALARPPVDLLGIDARDGGERRGRGEAGQLVRTREAGRGPGGEGGRDLRMRRDALVVDDGEERVRGAAGGVRQTRRIQRVLARAAGERVADRVQADGLRGRPLLGGDGEHGQRHAVELLHGPRDGLRGEQRVREVEEVGDAGGVDAAVAHQGGERCVVERAQAGREREGVGHGRPASGTCRPCDVGGGR
ncbi:hypothetical protein ACI6SL_12210 [Clavibacter nebraskensis]|uniref:hypothetical protein n=1 Tax=Clavibacter nebraskensis TaxID=31963 RepID=UPI003DA09E03